MFFLTHNVYKSTFAFTKIVTSFAVLIIKGFKDSGELSIINDQLRMNSILRNLYNSSLLIDNY